jgi:hypothetical protein
VAPPWTPLPSAAEAGHEHPQHPCNLERLFSAFKRQAPAAAAGPHAYIYFNTRALKRATAAVSWEEFEEWMRRLPVPEDEDVIVAEHSSDKGSDGGSSNEEDAPTTE